MESYYFSEKLNKLVGIYDKRLSTSFYHMWVKPLLFNARQQILYGRIDNALFIIQKRIKELRKLFEFKNPMFDQFYLQLSYHIVEFLRSDMTGFYTYYKQLLQQDYKVIMKNIIKYGHIELNSCVAEYFFNVFFGIENYVSNSIFNKFEINYVLLKLEFIF